MALQQVEKKLSSALAAYIKSVSEKPTYTVVVGSSVEENYRRYAEKLSAQSTQTVEKTTLEQYLEYSGSSSSIATGMLDNTQAALATQAARVQLQMGLQALLYPPPVASVERKDYALEPACVPKEEYAQLAIMVDIASMQKRLYLYIAQRDELLAGKNDSRATMRRQLIDLLGDHSDVAFDDKIKGSGEQYELSFSEDDLFNRVYTYTAQKSRFIAAAMAAKESNVGVERGADLWAMSPDERDNGVFSQLLNEGISEVGALLYPISKKGNKVVDGTSIYIDLLPWVTGALLRSIYGKVENLLVAYVLMKWYTIAGVAEEVKIQQAAYSSGLPFMQLLGLQDYTENMLRDFLRQGAADMYRRISGYCVGQSFVFDEVKEKETITILGLEWDKENTEGYVTFNTALIHADSLGKRLPTKDEYESLCELPHMWDDERKGMWFAEKVGDLGNTSKSIFFPALGLLSNGTNLFLGERGYYWCSTEVGSNNYVYRLYAKNSNAATVNYGSKDFGQPIRCINEIANTPATDTAGNVVILLNIPSSRIAKQQQPLAEAFSAGLYRYALAAWFGMQEDRAEQNAHLAEYDVNRSSMVIALGKRT